jgi:hypothetical protein
MSEIQIGRLMRSSLTGFVVGCRVPQVEGIALGALARVPLENDYQIYGMIHDIRIEDDGLVRQLVTAENIDASVYADNRVNRVTPLEISLLAVGYRQGGRVSHLLPPRPPLSLDVIYLCGAEELRLFTAAGRFGYFRHILRAVDLPVGELLAAHLQQAHAAHCQAGDADWSNRATQELITLLRDDYAALMGVLSALGDAGLETEGVGR